MQCLVLVQQTLMGLSGAEMWHCSVDQGLARKFLCGLEVTVLLSTDRKGEAVVVTSHTQLFPRGPSRDVFWVCQVFRSVIWRAHPAQTAALRWSMVQSLLLLCRTKGSFLEGSRFLDVSPLGGRWCCLCTQLFCLLSSECVSGQCWPPLFYPDSSLAPRFVLLFSSPP